ncbi:hypothetical protein C8J56DRAFT_824397 [Mycena floridula]|nr:hypothetical protein C8J56DRAFT_824397 [Mycena floridula]
MRPTLSCLSKASRTPLTGKRANKDFFKGTRQAILPGGVLRTGAPGKHIIGGSGKYRLLDERIRVYVAPPLAEIEASELKPYVHRAVRLPESIIRGQKDGLPGVGSLSRPVPFLNLLRTYSRAQMDEKVKLQIEETEVKIQAELSELKTAVPPAATTAAPEPEPETKGPGRRKSKKKAAL